MKKPNEMALFPFPLIRATATGTILEEGSIIAGVAT
jgi:hypothetical protein